MKKKAYEAPYFRPRFMNAIEPLMVSEPDRPKDPFEGGFSNEEVEDAN